MNFSMFLGILVGIVIGGFGSVVYFSYTGSTLKWKRSK